MTLRTAPSFPIGALWANVLADHGIPARCVSDPGASFMGDGVEHRLRVRADQAAEAAAILAAVWADEASASDGRDAGEHGQ